MQPEDSLKPSTAAPPYRQDWLILGGLWLAATLFSLIWLLLDKAPPAWDQGEHLTRALNYWRVLQQPEWGNPDWWTTLWRQSPGYRSPLVYLATVPLFEILGRGFDQAVLVNSGFMGGLMVVVYGLGRHLFDRRTGLWAAALCLLVPSLYILQVDYLLDLGLVACVTAAFACLTFWRTASVWGQWLWALGFGLCMGLTVLAKPTGIMFLIVPIVWIAVESVIRPPRWQHCLQWLLAAAIALLVCGPWVSTNWLIILTNSNSNNSQWNPAEVVPGSLWSAVSYYARMVPRMVTYPLLVVTVGSWLLALLVWATGLFRKQQDRLAVHLQGQWPWLLAFLLGSYGILTLLKNKDPRHITPAVPIFLIVLVRGLTAWANRRWGIVRWALVGILTVLMLGSLLPIAQIPTNRLVRPLYPGPTWPNAEVIDTMLAEAPYLRSTLGVVPNTAQITHTTMDYYGALQDFRVSAREVGFNTDFAPLDAASLTWVLTKTGDQGPPAGNPAAKQDLQIRVEQSPEYTVTQTWTLPDASTLSLYHRQQPPAQVTPLSMPVEAVALATVTVPPTAPPGSTIPVQYTLQGPWADLKNGLLVLTWETAEGNRGWIHDHGIGFGHVYAGLTDPVVDHGFEVQEQTGMIVPATVPPGVYRLNARYVNRQTGESRDLPTPAVQIAIAPNAPPQAAPQPDLVGLLHQVSQGLATGVIDPVFATVGRINQYDPVQDYLVQAEQAMAHRLETDPENPEWLYTQIMAQVLQQEAEAAIAALNQLTAITPNNVYPWLYLGFVHLYSWQPGQANQALQQAEAIAPDLPELKVLQAVAALQRLNVVKAWRLVQASGLLA